MKMRGIKMNPMYAPIQRVEYTRKNVLYAPSNISLRNHLKETHSYTFHLLDVYMS